MWGIDVIGAIEPRASYEHRFILFAIDYFTKWVEAASYSSVTRGVVVRFIKKEIICRYGLPQKIITDCRNVPFAGERGRGSRVRFPMEERCVESPPTFICGKRRKNRRKPVKMKILSSGLVFTLEEGISTSHVCLKGQQTIF